MQQVKAEAPRSHPGKPVEHVGPHPTPGKVAPHVARSPLKREIKVFTVEFSSNFEAAIPHGWTPFAVHALPGSGSPRALIYAYK